MGKGTSHAGICPLSYETKIPRCFVYVYIISHRQKWPWSGMQDMFAPAPVKLYNDLAHKVIYEMELKSKNKV